MFYDFTIGMMLLMVLDLPDLLLIRKTGALLRAKISALLRRKTPAVLRARTCALSRANAKDMTKGGGRPSAGRFPLLWRPKVAAFALALN